MRQQFSQKYHLKTYRRLVERSCCLLLGVGGNGIGRISLLRGQEQKAVRKRARSPLSKRSGGAGKSMYATSLLWKCKSQVFFLTAHPSFTQPLFPALLTAGAPLKNENNDSAFLQRRCSACSPLLSPVPGTSLHRLQRGGDQAEGEPGDISSGAYTGKDPKVSLVFHTCTQK